jgi:two-component sensor histidine kinase
MGRAEIDFLAGDGEMAARTRACDWGVTPLGPPEAWPQSLRLVVRLMLNSRHPMFIWWGPELIQFYNDAYRATMGPERHPGALGARGRECWDEIWPLIGPQIDYVMAGQGATWDVERLVPVTRHGRREDVWWTYGYSPIDLEGSVGGVLVICNDVTEHVKAQNRLQLLNEELKHRVKNTIAVIGAIAGQTLRGTGHNDELAAFHARLQAFGRAHDILTAHEHAGLPINDVVTNALAPLRSGLGRFSIEGPGMALGPQQALSLSLAIHELATNAAKYGALSNEAGRVRISWHRDEQADLPLFHFNWQESNGPPVTIPSRHGFGSQLIRRVLAGDFGGDVTMTFDPEGLKLRLTAPVDRCCPPQSGKALG